MTDSITTDADINPQSRSPNPPIRTDFSRAFGCLLPLAWHHGPAGRRKPAARATPNRVFPHHIKIHHKQWGFAPERQALEQC